MSNKTNYLKVSVSGYHTYNIGDGTSILVYDCNVGKTRYRNTILRVSQNFQNHLKAKIVQYRGR